MFLDVDMERAHREQTGEQLHVFVNGVDVTRRCVRADTEAGYAMVYCEDPAAHDPAVVGGAKHLHPDERSVVCRHRLDGVIEIAPGEKFLTTR